jgi:hypothetical protein
VTDDREVFRVRREAGLAKRHETREDRFHDRVRDVIAEGLVGTYWNTAEGPPRVDISRDVAETIAPRAYQSLLDAGYVVIPASEEAP